MFFHFLGSAAASRPPSATQLLASPHITDEMPKCHPEPKPLRPSPVAEKHQPGQGKTLWRICNPSGHDGPPLTTTNRPLTASPTPGDRKFNNIFLAAPGNGLGNQTQGAAEAEVPGAPAMPCAAGSAHPLVPAGHWENVHGPGKEFQRQKLGCTFQLNSARHGEKQGVTVFGFFLL